MDAIEKGVAMVFQESNLVQCISVAENIFLGKLNEFSIGGIISWERLYKQTSKILKKVKIDINPKTLVFDLDIGRRKMIEFARVLYYCPKLMILDEITACLTKSQIITLFEWIKKKKEEGTSIIYISHRIGELFEIADRVTILRDGRVITTLNHKGLTIDELSSLTVGRDIEASYHLYSAQKEKIVIKDKEMLSVENLNKQNSYKNISFKIKKGEILGLAGLDGSGAEEVVESIFGVTNYDSGVIKIKGKNVIINNTKDAIKYNLAYIPKEREAQGLINIFSVKRNITLAIMKKLINKIFLSKRKENDVSEEYKEKLQIKCTSIETLCNQLSGGNKQKVVLAKWLASDVDILLLNNPTRGVDVGVKADIYSLIFQLAQEGIAMLLVSSELTEIIRLSHRIITMKYGKVTGIFLQEETMVSEEKLMSKMM